MTDHAPSRAEIDAACQELSRQDPHLAKAYSDVGAPDWRATTVSYETLARAVTYQLISLQAAGAIWQRVCAQLEHDICPERVLSLDEDRLRACGLSRPKVGHVRSIAEAIQSGALCFNRLRHADISAARRELLAVRGIGPWTADLFLMNALGHMDAFPQGDVGIMESYRLLQGAETREPAKDFLKRAEAWRPYRGVAAHLLWAWLHQWRDAAPA